MGYNRVMRIGELEKVYKAVSSRKRLEILKLLADGKERTVGDIATAIHLSFKSTSKHLVLLRQVGFLDRRQFGYVGLYSLDDQLSALLNQLLRQIRQIN